MPRQKKAESGETVLSDSEALKEQLREEYPDWSDEQVETEVQKRLNPTPNTKQGVSPYVPPVRDGDNPVPQGTF